MDIQKRFPILPYKNIFSYFGKQEPYPHPEPNFYKIFKLRYATPQNFQVSILTRN